MGAFALSSLKTRNQIDDCLKMVQYTEFKITEATGTVMYSNNTKHKIHLGYKRTFTSKTEEHSRTVLIK